MRSTCPNCDGGCATVSVASAPVAPFEERGEVDVDELVAVHREHVAALAPCFGRVADPASAPEALGLARAGELDAEPREVALELLLLPAETAHDDALDARDPQPPDLPCEEGPAADGHERLRAAGGGVAEALRLAAGEDDRLHAGQGVPFDARPIAA